MPDSTLPHIKMQWAGFTPAGVKLLFVAIYIFLFSLALYVIFIFGLDYIHRLSYEKNTYIKVAQLEAYRLQQQINQQVLLLEQRIYLPSVGAQAEINSGPEIAKSLDSLQAILEVWQQPQALQLSTALRLSVHRYNKILAEAIALSKQTTTYEVHKPLQDKIALELRPQAGEITSQINDLVNLLQATLSHQNILAIQHISILKRVLVGILLIGGIVSYFLTRTIVRQLIAQRKVVKEQLASLQITKQALEVNQQKLTEKEENLCSVINNTADGIYAVNRQYQLTVINQPLQTRLAQKGIYLEVGQDCSRMFEGETSLWKTPFERAFAGERTIISTQQLQAAGKEYTELHYQPIKCSSGEVVGVAVFIQNVTPRYQNEAQLEQLLKEAQLRSEEVLTKDSELRAAMVQMQQAQEILQHKEAHLQAVINNTDDKIVAIDTNYTITFMNTALKELCASKDIFIREGSDYRKMFEGVEEKVWKPDYERAFAGEKFVMDHVQNLFGEGMLEVAYHPVMNKQGEVTGVCIFTHDITQLVTHEHQLQKLYAIEQETNEELQAQQEELRQNLEELMSTQEELEKTQHILRLKEARLRALINNTGDAIFSIDIQYNITVINQVMLDVYKLRYAEISEGVNFLAALPSEKKQAWKHCFDQALQGEQFLITWEDTPYAENVFHELSFNPVKTDTHEVVGVSIFIRDITERRKQEQEKAKMLKEAEDREEELMAQGEMMRDNLYELMITRDELEKKEAELSSQINAINKSNNLLELDLNGTILDVNESFLHLMHYTGEELIGQNYRILIPEDETNTEATLELWSKLKEGEFYSGEFRRITKTGEIVWMKATYNPVLDSQGKPYKLIQFTFDITDRVQDAIEKKRLYEKISIDAEELRMQEEELRQNLEELKVIQETLVQQKEHIQEKEARLRALIDNTEDDIYAIDTNYSITILNKALQSRYEKKGLPLQVGYNIFSIIAAANTAYWKVNFDKAIAGEKFSIVDQVITKDGEVFYDVSLNPIWNDKNQVTGVSVLSRNINQYKLAEKENLQTIDVLRKIQERVASMNSEKENEIEEYKKKVEKLKAEMNKKIKV
ncbi:PAS domain S-box protein [Rhodocytophaga aerolata]|uniref:PAS domain S-box protein n=1 Tax=Rhodocytophaga aerolata TaxID=455078 RepID=A0ABT8R3Z1_9BACT|nr:PAS domain S-box protein [Rhodocytophaga aerolata]MDO1445360.1 PAS domain S-box protein [Rhodocytophaga aerolata]